MAMLLVGVGALVLAMLATVGVLMLVLGDDIPEDSVLVLDLSTELPETRLWASGWFGPESPDFHAVTRALDRAATDERIRGLLVRGEGTELGWGRMIELRNAIAGFGASGKPVVAAFESPGIRDYLLATAADSIHLHPRGRLMLFGTPLGALFFGELLEKVGVGAQFEAIGSFKNAPDAYTRTGMTEAHREQLAVLAGDFMTLAVESVAEARGLAPERARDLLSGGPFLAATARELDLVDALAYPDQAEEEFDEPHFLSIREYATRGGGSGPPRIAVIHVDGAIVSGASSADPLMGRVAGAETVTEALDRVREMDSVEAVVLRIASPGGLDTASDTIWRSAERVREDKPVVASLGDVAASGGYWVATAASHLVANPATITGSIGVFAGKIHIGGMFEKIGVAAESVFPEGVPPNNWTNPVTPLTAAERARLREGIADTYAVFLDRVAAARGMSPDQVDALGQGRVWSGHRALEVGLVDEMGGLDAALRQARLEAGIPEDEEIRILHLPEPPGLAESFLQDFGGMRAFRRSPVLRALLRGSWFALMPFIPQPN